MSCPTQGILGENITFTVQAKTQTGSPVDATGSVSYSVYEDETSTAILTGTMAKFNSQTGFYSEQLAVTAANGFEQFKSYTIRITATINSVAVSRAYSFICMGSGDTPQATSGALTSTANYKTFAGITSSDDDSLIGDLISRATSAIESYCGRTLTSATYRERYDGDGDLDLIVNEYPITAVTLLTKSTTDALGVKNDSSDAYHAAVTVTSSAMSLVVSGGTNDGTNSLILSSYTITELAAAIIALGGGWTALVQSTELGLWDSVEILTASGLGCLDGYCYPQLPGTPLEGFQILSNEGVIHVPSMIPVGSQNVVVKYTAGYTTTPADLEQICIDLVNVYYRSRKKDMSLKSERLGDHSITFADGAKDLSKEMQVRLAPYKRWRV